MNNIYVDVQPESCLDCEFCVKRNYCCILIQKDVREYRDDCPLISLSVRLVEERKKVVSEIRDKISEGIYQNSYGETFIDGDIYEILDQIAKG